VVKSTLLPSLASHDQPTSASAAPPAAVTADGNGVDSCHVLLRVIDLNQIGHDPPPCRDDINLPIRSHDGRATRGGDRMGANVLPDIPAHVRIPERWRFQFRRSHWFARQSIDGVRAVEAAPKWYLPAGRLATFVQLVSHGIVTLDRGKHGVVVPNADGIGVTGGISRIRQVVPGRAHRRDGEYIRIVHTGGTGL